MFAPPLSWADKLLEAAKAWGYKLYEWDRESHENKAVVLGFYLWQNHRESYEADMQARHRKGNEKEDVKQKNHPVYRHREEMLRARLAREQGQ